MNKKVFTKVVLNKNSKTFVIYVIAIKIYIAKTIIYPLQTTLIINDDLLQVAALFQDETFIKVLHKYPDYANIFLYNLLMKLSENIGINKHAIEQKKGK